MTAVTLDALRVGRMVERTVGKTVDKMAAMWVGSTVVLTVG